MKLAIALMMGMAGNMFAQAPKQEKKPPAEPTYTSVQKPHSPPMATWSDQVKDGIYSANFVDPSNHWRCVVTGTLGEGQLGGIHAFTVACWDTTKTNQALPAPSKQTATPEPKPEPTK